MELRIWLRVARFKGTIESVSSAAPRVVLEDRVRSVPDEFVAMMRRIDCSERQVEYQRRLVQRRHDEGVEAHIAEGLLIVMEHSLELMHRDREAFEHLVEKHQRDDRQRPDHPRLLGKFQTENNA